MTVGVASLCPRLNSFGRYRDKSSAAHLTRKHFYLDAPQLG